MVSPRYFLAVVAGLAVAVFTWGAIGGSHMIFMQLSLAGQIPGVVAGLLGGFVVALVAPRRKVVLAFATGAVLSIFLLGFFLRHGIPSFDRDTLLYCWPVWLGPTFALGGYFARNLWLSPNTSLERTRER